MPCAVYWSGSVTGVETQRLFFALWPDAVARDRLQALGEHIPRSQGKPVPVDKLHLTLAFLGAVDGETRRCAEGVADGIGVPPFRLALDWLGHFPRPRVVWVGTNTPPPALLALVEGLAEGLERCGIPREHRPFRAHLTLARKVRRFSGTGTVEPVTWPVNEFSLVRSRTLPQGAVYEVLRRWPLNG